MRVRVPAAGAEAGRKHGQADEKTHVGDDHAGRQTGVEDELGTETGGATVG